MTSDFRVFVTDPPVRHTPDKCVVFNRTALLLLFFWGGFFCSAEELQARLFESFKKKKKKRKKCHTSRGDRGLFCLHLFALYSAAFVQWRLYFCTQYYLFFRLLLHSRTHTVSFRLKQIVACQVLTREKKKSDDGNNNKKRKKAFCCLTCCSGVLVCVWPLDRPDTKHGEEI